MIIKIQAITRGYLARKLLSKRVKQITAINIIQRNARIFVQLQESPWWKLFVNVRPLLGVARVDNALQELKDQVNNWKYKYEEELEKNIKLEQSHQSIETKYNNLRKVLEDSQAQTLYLERFNHELELLINDKESEISRLTGYLDRFCLLFKNIMPDE